MCVSGREIEGAVSLSNFGEISSHPAEVVFIYVRYFSVSSETIGVRYMEKGGGLDTYFLYECMGTVLLVAELPNRKMCSLSLFAGFMHGGFSSIFWLSDIL